MSRPAQVLRVFTRGTEGGNHLGVVNDRSGLTAEGMQGIAAELGFSESAFVEWFDESRPPDVRIFSPVVEMPFAGHPLVGAAWVLARLGPGPEQGTLACGIGPVSYRLEGEVTWIDVPFSVESADAGEAKGFLAAAGLAEPVRTWRKLLPKEYVIAEYASVEDIAAISPDMDRLAARFGTLVFTRSGPEVRSRFFAPAAGVPEDPATGSAAVALAHAFVTSGEESGRVTIEQGAEIGHPSCIELTWKRHGASIGGTVVRDEVRFLEH